ncbi:uncharacterized protein LOC117192157, partial [Drosophila miranda]|uniref:uncharacterized protein LOC117192157 n=1 Tax=Drosophila miranda TaxID=7229 RepID=UPI00143F9E1B
MGDSQKISARNDWYVDKTQMRMLFEDYLEKSPKYTELRLKLSANGAYKSRKMTKSKKKKAASDKNSNIKGEEIATAYIVTPPGTPPKNGLKTANNYGNGTSGSSTVPWEREIIGQFLLEMGDSQKISARNDWYVDKTQMRMLFEDYLEKSPKYTELRLKLSANGAYKSRKMTKSKKKKAASDKNSNIKGEEIATAYIVTPPGTPPKNGLKTPTTTAMARVEVPLSPGVSNRSMATGLSLLIKTMLLFPIEREIIGQFLLEMGDSQKISARNDWYVDKTQMRMLFEDYLEKSPKYTELRLKLSANGAYK